MQFGVHLPNSGPFASRDAIIRMATTAERLGYDAVQLHDHVNWGIDDRDHFYAGSKEAGDLQPDNIDFYDSLSTLGFLAGVTNSIKLIPTAICLAWRPALLLARQVSSLYQLSNRRLVLNVCVGNVRKDFEVTGTPWDLRGKIAVEKLKVLRMLIDRAGPLSFEGEHVSFEHAQISPRPEGLRLWYAGTSSIALKRAARYADGWCPTGGPDYFRANIARLRAEAQRVGRGHIDFDFATDMFACIANTNDAAWAIAGNTVVAHDESEWMQRHDEAARGDAPLVGAPDTVARGVRRFREAGLTHLNLCLVGHTLSDLLKQMEWFAQEVIPRST